MSAVVTARPVGSIGPAARNIALAVGILFQIAYPLLDGDALRAVTVGSVLALALAALLDAATRFGVPAAVKLLVVAGGIGLVAEAVGVRTGFPFGAYAYSGTLGPQVLGVPVVVPLAWTMFGYPSLLVGRRLGRPALGALTLAAWDLFLDPQMVAAGHWTWTHPEPGLPGVPGIPLTNFAGWLLVAFVLVSALHRVLPKDHAPPRAELVPALVVAWTWLGSTLGSLAFFDRPVVALYGFVALGVTAVPYFVRLRRGG